MNSNVVLLEEKKREISPVQRTFDNFIQMQTPNTRKKYETTIPEFFKMVCGKELWELDEDDLEMITPNDVREKYYLPLQSEKGFKNATIINYMSTVRSFVNELNNNRVFHRRGFTYDYLINVALSVKGIKDDTTERPTMTYKEYQKFHDWLVSGKEWSTRYKDHGRKYQLALEFMFITATRLNATFNNVTWYDIKLEQDSFGNEGYVVHALDKGGKINKKPITKEFYEELKEEFYTKDTDIYEPVFSGISERSFQNLIREFSKEYNIYLTPHSIKNGAGTHLWRMTGNILLVKEFLDHESLDTTMKYVRDKTPFYQTGSYLLSEGTQPEEISEYSAEEIMEVLKENKELAMSVVTELKSKKRKGEFMKND